MGQTGTVLSLASPWRLWRDLAAQMGCKSQMSDVARVSLKPLHGWGPWSIASPCGACTNTLRLLGVPGWSSGLGWAVKPGNGISYKYPFGASSAAQCCGPSLNGARFCAGGG